MAWNVVLKEKGKYVGVERFEVGYRFFPGVFIYVEFRGLGVKKLGESRDFQSK